MKIGVVTVQYANNVGAFLQAYSLKNVLEGMGHDVVYLRTCSDKEMRGMFYRIRPYGKEWGRLIPFIKKNYEGWKKHLIFKKEQRCFRIVDSVKNEEIDLVILGSDEIWNMGNHIFRNPVFWGHNIEHVMTYAISMGNAEFEDMKIIPLNDLKKISPILVRDTMTYNYLKSIGVESQKVCDPTILVDPQIFKHKASYKKIKDKYILVYSYGHEVNELVIKSLKSFAKKNKLKLISASFKLEWCDETIHCSPLEFSSLVEGASYVFTSTFHGTIFSILNHKSFISLPYSVKTRDLLYDMELEDRLIDKNTFNEKHLYEKWIHTSIDYEMIENKLKKYREESLLLLESGLKIYE